MIISSLRANGSMRRPFCGAQRGLRLGGSVARWLGGSVARWLGADAARNGAVKVNADGSVPGRPEIFVVGDSASFDHGLERPLPGLAPVAKQQGHYDGRLLKATVQGKSGLPPFRYRDYGTMAVIGRSRALAHLGRVRLKGLVAWLAWSLVQFMLLVDFRSRLMVYANWSWAWFTYGRGARLLMGVPTSTSCEVDDPENVTAASAGAQRSPKLGV
ncbi:hypothetical protein [Sphingobium sp. DC-2]|uniref:hypothetical protein n=1 Tax=Sphingobium sp. DC-2 TaxID=1303256 RepID=UPI0004C2BB9C|nr:hypothetical protein [Sphingobium sp. DC-2]